MGYLQKGSVKRDVKPKMAKKATAPTKWMQENARKMFNTIFPPQVGLTRGNKV